MTAGTQLRGTRSEIQALRALAVLAVVVFHIWPTSLPGGFVGVDIFFVISGFLITSHLLREVSRHGTVKLGQFWARRIRRLLPAAFIVLAFSLVVTLTVLSWSDWRQGLHEILASAFYIENWALALDSVDYLAAENSASLVQHYWSLSVEEQFYIVWPLLILGALWLARSRNATPIGQKRVMMIALLVVFVGSLATSIIWTDVSSASAYFVTPTRAWEFAAGGLLAFLPARFAKPTETRGGTVVHLFVSWAGLSAIGYAVLQYSSSTAFPSYTALLPVAGTVAVIWASENSSSWSPTLIGRSGPIQWVGDVSYSLYLWHWPLVVMYPLVQGHPIGVKGGFGLLLFCLVLAGLSKRYVEDPFRDNSWWSRTRRSYGFALTGMVAIGATVMAAGFIIDTRFAAAERPHETYANVQQLQSDVASTLASSSWAIPDQTGGRDSQSSEWVIDGCLDVTNAEERDRCTYGNEASEKTLALIGDSYATQLLPALRGAFGEQYRIVPMTLSQCPVIDVSVSHSAQDGEFSECREHNAKNLELLDQIQPDLVVVSDSTSSTHWRIRGTSTSADEDKAFEEGAGRAYTQIAGLNLDNVVVVEAPPSANCEPTSRFSAPRDCAVDATTVRVRELQELKLNAAGAVGLPTVDMTSWLCTDRLVCPVQIGNQLTRADGAHFSNSFATVLQALLGEAITSAVR